MKYRKLKGYKYELLESVSFNVTLLWNLCAPNGKQITWVIDNKYIKWKDDWLKVKAHYAWDGPSGPTIDTKTFMRGALIHDVMYQLMRECFLHRKHRKYADQLLRKVCLGDGMSKFRAWYVYRAVRLFCKKSSMPRKNPRGQVVEI